MHTTLLAIRILLAAAFGVAAVSKLADVAGSRRGLIDFGVPRALAPVLVWLIPALELPCAAALLSARTASWGALGVSALLAIFTAAISVNLARGRDADCHCFGRIAVTPPGWPTLVRNGVLFGLGAYVAMEGRAAAAIIALTAAWIAAGVWFGRRFQDRAASPPIWLGAELPVGTHAPAFSLADLSGKTVSLDDLRACGLPVLLLFASSQCRACDTVLPDAARWQRELSDRLLVVVISSPDTGGNREKAAIHGLRHVLLQRADEVRIAYGVDELPSGLIVKGEQVASALMVGKDDIGALVDLVTNKS
jgi:peroxiredoxin